MIAGRASRPDCSNEPPLERGLIEPYCSPWAVASVERHRQYRAEHDAMEGKGAALPFLPKKPHCQSLQVVAEWRVGADEVDDKYWTPRRKTEHASMVTRALFAAARRICLSSVILAGLPLAQAQAGTEV